MDQDVNQDSSQADRVTCPKCGEAQQATIVTAIHRDDAALDSLFDGSLNRVSCESCGVLFLLDVPLVYRDDDARYLIYFMPLANPGDWERAEADMRKLTQHVFEDGAGLDPPECRLTVSRRGFIEKIALHLHRLDDRLVEYVKYQLQSGPARRVDPIRSELLYDFSAGDPDTLCFVVVDRESGEASAGAHLPMDVYNELAEVFLGDGGMEDELEKLFPGYYVSVDRLLLS